MKVNVKRLNPNAVLPKYAKSGDAGMDITAISKSFEGQNLVYGTGLAIEIPEGHVGLLFPRSSVTKYSLSLGNAVGVIDSGFRGELVFKFKPTAYFSKDEQGQEVTPKHYDIGDRVGQLVIIPYPKVELNEVEELSESERGEAGFGSTS